MRGPTDAEATIPGPASSTADDALARQHARYARIEASEEFRELRARYRKFVIPVTLGALTFYFAYAILAAYADARSRLDLIPGRAALVSKFAPAYKAEWTMAIAPLLSQQRTN